MEVETTIAQGLHVTDDSAGYDAACKRVLSEKAIADYEVLPGGIQRLRCQRHR